MAVFHKYRKRGYGMSQEQLRDRLIRFIKVEGVNQKHISIKTGINQGLLSQFKNERVDELGIIDTESLDEFLLSKGY